MFKFQIFSTLNKKYYGNDQRVTKVFPKKFSLMKENGLFSMQPFKVFDKKATFERRDKYYNATKQGFILFEGTKKITGKNDTNVKPSNPDEPHIFTLDFATKKTYPCGPIYVGEIISFIKESETKQTQILSMTF